jgi:hypothetical protein
MLCITAIEEVVEVLRARRSVISTSDDRASDLLVQVNDGLFRLLVDSFRIFTTPVGWRLLVAQQARMKVHQEILISQSESEVIHNSIPCLDSIDGGAASIVCGVLD